MGASIEHHVLTITDPVIKLDELKFVSYGEENPDKSTAKLSEGLRKIVSINGMTFSDDEILTLTLNCTGKIPTINVSIADLHPKFSADSIPRDGDVLSLRLGHLDKTSYKDIRIDFDITSLDASNQDYNVIGNSYRFSGRMKIPGLHSDECKSYGSATSIEHIEAIANDLKLGLATNIETTDDKMTLILPNSPRTGAIDDLVAHSYIDEDSFQTYAIDPYYYINYVNLNSLINSEESFTDIILGLNAQFNDQPNLDGSSDAALNQIKDKLILNNHKLNLGTNLYIESHSIINTSASVVKRHGYKRTLQFFENDSDEGLVSHIIEPLASKNLRDIEEPMKGRRGEDIYKSQTKTKYIGRKNADLDSSHTHLNYEYAEIHNAQNLAVAKKMMLEVTLPVMNPAIHLFQKIPVVIYIQDENRVRVDRQLKRDLKEKGFPINEEDGFIDNEEQITYAARVVPDTFLSAYYVVIGIEYKYYQGDDNVSQTLTLLRREWPSRLNNLTQKTLSAPIAKPEAPPPPPPVAPPVPPPPPPPPPPPAEEYVYTIEKGEGRNTNIREWTSSQITGLWKATPEGAPPPSKITLEVKIGADTYPINNGVDISASGVWVYNPEKNKFALSFGSKSSVVATITAKLEGPKGETAEGSIGSTSVVKWVPNDVYDGPNAVKVGKVYFKNETKSSETPGTYIGTYTKNGEATKEGRSTPMSGRIEGTDIQKVISETQAAADAERMASFQ